MIQDEKILNNLLKNKKSGTFTLLYYSEWDTWCDRILERVDKWKEEEGNEDLYLVSSWQLPHAFAAFSITNAPSIVKVKRGRVTVLVEYPRVYNYFNFTDCAGSAPE